MQTKNITCKLNIVHANKKLCCKLKIENISMQIKNEKSCARTMSDEDLVRAGWPGLTAVDPFMFHVCNIFSLHVQFLICMSWVFLICSNIFNLQVKFLFCSNIFNLHVRPFWATVLLPVATDEKDEHEKKLEMLGLQKSLSKLLQWVFPGEISSISSS